MKRRVCSQCGSEDYGTPVCGECGVEWTLLDDHKVDLKEHVRVLREALEPFNVILDFHGVKGGGMASMLVYKDEIDAVKAALEETKESI